MHDAGVESLFRIKAIAAELSRLTGGEVSEQRAKYWCAKGYIPAWKIGPFWASTRSALRERFRVPSAGANPGVREAA
jgi:hypothetical protein